MDAQVRFIDGEARSFSGVTGMRVHEGSLVVSRWFRVVAVIPLAAVRWAKLAEKRKISDHDFKRASL